MNLVIIQHELKEFYQRWKTKADGHDSESLADYFDRFFTLFVIYNRIYNVVNVILAEQGELKILKETGKIKKKNNTDDNQAATICIAHFLREELNEIVAENQVQIDEFIYIIKERLFNIVLKNGKPQRHEDLELENGLESDDAVLIVESLLIILYKMRCNVFHAEKGFNNSQIRILEPANICLNNLVERLIVKVMVV